MGGIGVRSGPQRARGGLLRGRATGFRAALRRLLRRTLRAPGGGLPAGLGVARSGLPAGLRVSRPTGVALRGRLGTRAALFLRRGCLRSRCLRAVLRRGRPLLGLSGRLLGPGGRRPLLRLRRRRLRRRRLRRRRLRRRRLLGGRLLGGLLGGLLRSGRRLLGTLRRLPVRRCGLLGAVRFGVPAVAGRPGRGRGPGAPGRRPGGRFGRGPVGPALGGRAAATGTSARRCLRSVVRTGRLGSALRTGRRLLRRGLLRGLRRRGLRGLRGRGGARSAPATAVRGFGLGRSTVRAGARAGRLAVLGQQVEYAGPTGAVVA
ncbi:hypothetical protein [Saccharopolyspora gloriosae]|uniref:hypothetical protein n=1 Tax=Saccharopolyspora gloriosae TaxID=455344 RepID=UPI001FB82859|nr:hypothetical protein [Saccharopolyspora gloriosae]